MANQPHILPDEKNLFARAAQGDQAAFTAIFDHYMPRIYGYILKYTKSETSAQDITQDVFAKLWEKRQDLATIESHASYIFTAAFRTSINHFKKEARETRLIKEYHQQTGDEVNDIEDSISFKESNHLLQLAIDQMPPQRQLIYKLNKEDGLSYDEIAEKLNISRNTVKNTIAEATAFVRKFISENAVAFFAFFIFK